MNTPVKLNSRQGGSYTKDPQTGKRTLIQQTKHQEITGFEQQEEAVETKSTTKKAQAK